ILEMALAKDPNQRFQSVGALLRAVQGLQQPGRGEQPGGDFSTRAALPSSPAYPLPSRSGPAYSTGLPTRTAGEDAPPRGTSAGYGSNPGRGVISPQSMNDAPSRPGRGPEERDRYSSYGGSQPPGGRGGWGASAPPYSDPYGEEGTFATERPRRRPTNPYG